MGLVTVDNNTLFSIASSIRSVNGEDTRYKPSEMASAIRQFKLIPEANFKPTGDCDYAFAGTAFSNLIDNTYIEGTGITSAEGMFYKYNGEKIYADLTFDTTKGINAAYMFANCENLENVSADFISFYPKDCRYMFVNCHNLKYEPDLNLRSKAYSKFNETTTRKTGMHYLPEIPGGGEVGSSEYGSCKGMFKNCHSLNSISDYVMPGLYNEAGDEDFYTDMFMNCYTLDTIGKIPVNTEKEIDENQFFGMVRNCFRLRKFLFEKDTNGKPLVAKWKNQYIDLRTIGCVPSDMVQECIFGYNSLIKDRAIEITTPSEFAQYHNNGYSWTSVRELSRYTYEDMIETIESLPDTSAYTGGELLNEIYFSWPSYYEDGTSITTDRMELLDTIQAMGASKGWQINLGGNYGQRV